MSGAPPGVIPTITRTGRVELASDSICKGLHCQRRTYRAFGNKRLSPIVSSLGGDSFPRFPHVESRIRRRQWAAGPCPAIEGKTHWAINRERLLRAALAPPVPGDESQNL